MIEETVLNYLKRTMLNTTVTMEIRQGLPDSFVFLEKIGSSREDLLSASRFAIQSYGKSLLDAMTLNESVKTAMFGIVSEPEISAVRLNSDYNYTDLSTKKPRYQAVFEVTHY